jgi:two-component system invasion response regulator UvrY
MPSLVFFETNPALRRRVMTLLVKMPDIKPVGQAVTGAQLLELCRTGPWDAALVDLLAPRENAMGLLKQLREDCPTLPIVAVSFALEPELIKRCLALDIAALVASEDIPDEFEAALRTVIGGQDYLSNAVRRVLDAEAPR